jgi:hypothetical protein
VFVTLLYGVEVKVHFFGADTRPTEQLSRNFLERNFPNHVTNPQCNTVDVFFHQYGRRENCSVASYNYFGMLLPFPGRPNTGTLLNNLVVPAPQLGLPWWKQAPKDDKDPKNQASKGSKGCKKSVKKRSLQSKFDQKSKRASITMSYVQRMSGASKQAVELEAAWKEAQRRCIELAKEYQVDVEELDLPVHWFKQQEMSEGADAASGVVKVKQLTPHQCHRS